MTGRTIRADRASGTREAILETAERLFAEHGVWPVSNRQISEAAGQGNNTAVGYHFGSKIDLVRAIARRHTERIELIRDRMIAAVPESAPLRDWMGCLVRPIAEHLAELPTPTWFARFAAQVMTDPVLRVIMVEEGSNTPGVRRSLLGMQTYLSDLPADVRAERHDMVTQLMVHMYALRERALAEGAPTRRATWQDAATGLVDAVVGMWLADVTPLH
ncbi:MAG TPA: TetR family transcriptional regulator [Pseudonocardiaceae bacterium]|nr:TetR family transcriptional regulator [Pseudonocardiaceae bacterium]